MLHVAPVDCADAPIDRQQQRLTEIEERLAALALEQDALVIEHTTLARIVKLCLAHTADPFTADA
jgi:hypothetical protein